MRSLMMPSIHAVAELSSMAVTLLILVVVVVVAVLAGIRLIRFLSGGNKGRPENPQTAGGWSCGLGVVVIVADVAVDKNPDPPDVMLVNKPQAAMDLKTEILRVGGEVLRKAVVLVLHSQTDKGVRIETVFLSCSSTLNS
ncbi:hypothetical protein QYF36_020737 [Acer negundo]|nr:hypothetical protein QYF36_020737 [Acer negundo]